MRLPVAFAVAALLGSDPLAADARLDLTLDPASATVGDRVVATLTLHSAAGRDPDPGFPEWGDRWGEAEILDVGPVERIDSAAGVSYRQRITVTAFRTGQIELPPVVVRTGAAVPPEVRSAGATLEIRSVLPTDDPAPEPRPPSPPRRLPVPVAFYWLAAGLALAAAAAAAALIRQHRRRAPDRAPALSPLAELERDLERIRDAAPVSGHVELSLALRRYLGRTFSLPAPASTTREIGRRLDRCGLDTGLARRAARLLGEIDQVKFARRACDAEALIERSRRTHGIAGDVERHLRPAAPESPS